MKRLTLVTGAARSGKSEWAETLAKQSKGKIFYVATAMMTPNDAEWQERIMKHQQRRPSSWTTIAEPKKLTNAIAFGNPDECYLVDSLGTWVANLLEMDRKDWDRATDELLSCLLKIKTEIIFVAEETGWGVVPAYPMGRLFRGRLGHLSRQIGTIADKTYLVTGGHALDLSVLGTKINMK